MRFLGHTFEPNQGAGVRGPNLVWFAGPLGHTAFLTFSLVLNFTNKSQHKPTTPSLLRLLLNLLLNALNNQRYILILVVEELRLYNLLVLIDVDLVNILR